jgi:putative transposase
LIFHSDRGVQYTSHAFQNLIKSCDVKQSFSPSGRPHHNAVMESFFATMKKEELYRTNYHSLSEFKERVERYIDFYNNERPHVTLDYKAPNTHERLFYDKQSVQ